MSSPLAQEFFVACLCANWCGTCRDYREGFERLAAQFPHMCFRWVDIEDQAEQLAEFDLDVDNFPTVLVQRADAVLFCGPLLPEHALLRRLLETFSAQSAPESQRYASATAERRAWQKWQLRAAFLGGASQ